MIRIIKKNLKDFVCAFKLFLFFLKYLRKHRRKIITIFIMILLTSTFGAIIPLFGKIMIDSVIPKQNWSMFWIIMLVYAGGSIAIQSIEVFQKYLSFHMDFKVNAKLSLEHFRSLLAQPFAEIQQEQVGSQIFRATRDVSGVVTIITTFFTSIAGNCVSLAIAAAIMFRLNWKITLIYILFVPLILLLRFYVSLKIQPFQKKLREHNESISSFLGQVFSGVKVIKIYGTENYASLEYLRLLRSNMRLNFQIWVTQTIFGKIQWLFESGTASFLQWWIWFSVMKQYTSLGTAMALSWYFNIIVSPFINLAELFQEIVARMVYGERVFEILHNKKESLYEGKTLSPLSNGYSIKLRDVSFSYNENIEILKNVTFELKPGTITTLLGPSGSGKTTIINMICALYLPSGGEIEINETKMSQLKISSLRNLVALVPQEIFIPQISIMDNIRYSCRHATEDEVFKAARMACIHEKIILLPEKYATIIKKNQNDLSMGEQQRITIARAFLRKSPIMIFDEAFSNLDEETEQIIMNSLISIKNNRTIFIVSHRLKNVVLSDNVIFIKDGSIVESGPPMDLIEKKGALSELFKDSLVQNAEPVASRISCSL